MSAIWLALLLVALAVIATLAVRVRKLGRLTEQLEQDLASSDRLRREGDDARDNALRALSDVYLGPAGHHSVDEKGLFLDVNDTELELLQYRREEVVGKLKFTDVLTPASRQRFAREFPLFRERGRIDEIEFDLVRKDGTTVPVVLSARAVYDPAGKFVRSRSVVFVNRLRKLSEEALQRAYGELEERVQMRTAELNELVETMRDEIAHRERVEQLLRESDERARATIDASLDGIVTIDLEGRIQTVNPAAERMFGWKEDELAGETLARLMPDPLVPPVEEALQQAASPNATLLGTAREVRGRRSTGDEFPLEVSVSEMEIRHQRLYRATLRDLTERKQATERMQQLQEQLRRSEVLATIGSLVAGFAHEARNPLFGISAVLDAFTARFGDRQEYREHLALIRRDVDRLNALMHDLLEFGKPSTALHVGELKPVVEEALDQCQPLAEKAQVTLASDLEVGLPWLSMNERLTRAFQNLLQNAIQFSPRGTTVHFDTKVANGSHEDSGGWIECQVRDSGPGIPEEDLPRLFEPFFTRRRGGTGLGLAIVQRIVEEHHGTIAAGNQEQGGAVISIRLPATVTRAASSEVIE